jgi:hypothetical protein
MPNPFIGTSASDAINIASIQGISAPINNVTYTVDGGAGTDTFTLTSTGGAYNNIPKANFTISAADAAGVTTISGPSTGGTFYTFKLQNVETVVFKDATVQLSTVPAVADTTAPVYASVAANATSVVLTYTDANNLDATNKPPVSAFAVSGATSGSHTINSVAVNAAAKTVTLTLGTAVTTGESLTVTYTDPTAGNDALAIQDVSGNDAATSTHTITVTGTPILDTTAPTLSTSPATGVTGVAIGSNIDLTFSEAIQMGTGAIQLHTGSATGAAVSVNATVSGNTLTIDPTADLAYNTHYYVTLGTAATTSGSSGSSDDDDDDEHGGTTGGTTTTPATYGVTDLTGNGFDTVNAYDFTTIADPFVPRTNTVIDGAPVIVGVGGLGMLAWAFLL